MSYDRGTLLADGTFIFPNTRFPPYRWSSQPPVTLQVRTAGWGGALANLGPGPGAFNVALDPLWGTNPDSWGLSWGVDTLYYTSRDDTHIFGVQGYSASARLRDGREISTGYYNPDAYWTPPTVGAAPPPGADPSASVGQDPATLAPPTYNPYANKPYHYADLKIYDQMGKNRTGDDLAENPADPGSFDDPYDSGDNPLTFLYDDQDPAHSNLSGFDWEPDGDQVHNQRVTLQSANTEEKRSIRAIARNRTSWGEIGVYSNWDSQGGENVVDVSPDNLKGQAIIDVETYGRPPSFCKLYLQLEPADAYPVFGASGYHPQPWRDFDLGDRVKVRARKGYMDTGLQVMRIMGIKVSQADAAGNVTVEVDCVPHMTDVAEITAEVTGVDD